MKANGSKFKYRINGFGEGCLHFAGGEPVSIVDRGVRRARGTIVVESDVGAGTRFTIKLPRVATHAPAIMPLHALS